ncbi:hypothetical protein VF14_11575 [Nostoc linckia z18]|uniref:Uncharacterized protein n=2 Tax=Nostoc linckia TaxID=92942 RepID=A0A9Q6EK39_NOSLI|nr:hypothetical protein [Nostoc linckia]PHK40905.1 hypothetical protein VF12_08675 [Nostoc linckia z15]PHK46448.1 hypothetical protein VF13_10910 [Nostoc linckia z16]PHJ60248.1 hypothetical protein VF02_23065 [Nostoc linckia z1]PHJ63814.1 hypothetical protein VF05_24030 [Nostoc linckia z3]PHJ70828.1 hypothetical protein VF03_21600 [Nostoc linckia z2]
MSNILSDINRSNIIAYIERSLDRRQVIGLNCLIFLALREQTTVAYQRQEWGFTDIPEEVIAWCDKLAEDDLIALAADIAAGLLEELVAEPPEPICPLTAAGVDPFETELPQLSSHIPM